MESDHPEKELYLWMRAELQREYCELVAGLPWWCMICGEGGNYEGDRPDYYWFPPENHICPEVMTQHRESETIRRIIKKIEENEFKKQKIGKIKEIKETPNGLEVEFWLTDDGKKKFEELQKNLSDIFNPYS